MGMQDWMWSAVSFVPFLIGLTLFALVWRYNVKKIAALKAKDFSWYKRTHPDHVRDEHGKGARVSCNSCGGTHIGIERLMNRTFLRRHFCRQCGNTLYYSPETL